MKNLVIKEYIGYQAITMIFNFGIFEINGNK